MTLRRLVALAGTIALSAACSGSNAPQGPLEPFRTIAIPWNAHALAGYGDVLAFEYTDTSNAGSVSGFRSTLQVYRRDPAYPLELLDLGAVYLGVDTLYYRLSDLSLTGDWATVTLNYNESPSGWVAVVSLTSPAPTLVATLSFGQTLDRAIASGRWLLVAAGNQLALVDLGDASFPVVKTFDMGTVATGLLPVSGGFLVFTGGGRGRVVADATTATYTATADDTFRAFRKGCVVGTGAYVAGPSPFAGKTRVARVDVTDPGAPLLEASIDVEGAFGQFAYDGAGTYVLSFPDWQGTAVPTEWIRDGATLTIAAERSLSHLMPSDIGRLHVRGHILYVLDGDSLALYAQP